MCNQTVKQKRYETGIKTGSTNRIIICGILYVMTSQNKLTTYNTNDMTSKSIMTSSKIPSHSQYNPRDRLLYGWIDKNPVYYLIEFGDFESKNGKLT